MIHGSGRSPGRGNCTPLQWFCLKNPTDRGTWRATVYGVTKSQGVTEHACMDGPLSDDLGASLVAQTVTNLPIIHEAQVLSLGKREDPLKRRMATHFCILAWRIPRTKAPGRLQSSWQQGHAGLSH